MLYGEVRPSGHFRFVNFGHPPPLLFCAERRRFLEIDRDRMVQFFPLGLEVPEDHPDREEVFLDALQAAAGRPTRILRRSP